MIHQRLYSTDDLDNVVDSKLNNLFEDIEGYIFEGNDYNRMNFKRALVFCNDQIFKKSSIEIDQLDRWINAYYWYSVYIKGLENQNISIDNHKQSRFKLIEQIDYYTSSDFDWSVIKNIDKELELK